LVFVDEFGSNLAMTPTYARSPQGERAEVSEPFNQGSNISTIGSRKAKARTVRKLLKALAKIIEKVAVDDICGWFAHCGYTFSLI
jgi:hypothetical protein